jgi:hypothetical protein
MDTNHRKIVARLAREGWHLVRHGGEAAGWSSIDGAPYLFN